MGPFLLLSNRIPLKPVLGTYAASQTTLLHINALDLIKTVSDYSSFVCSFPVSILYKSIAGRYRSVRVHVADGPITVRYRFIKNASKVVSKG